MELLVSRELRVTAKTVYVIDAPQRLTRTILPLVWTPISPVPTVPFGADRGA
ncbi:MAG: hypothetical protein ACLQF1_18045 [Methyloceanibacter sp.]